MAGENLPVVYQAVCTSYHAIDDFRMKLLGFLPLATGAGLLVLLGDKAKMDLFGPFFLPLGIFGFTVTLGLFLYELHGIKKCDHLIKVGKKIETLILNDSPKSEGQFARRPHEVNFFTFKIDEKSTACVIYPAVLAAWTFLALVWLYPHPARLIVIASLVFAIGAVGSYRLNLEVPLQP